MEKYVLSGGEDSELTAEGWKGFPRWRRGGGWWGKGTGGSMKGYGTFRDQLGG